MTKKSAKPLIRNMEHDQPRRDLIWSPDLSRLYLEVIEAISGMFSKVVIGSCLVLSRIFV
jgi:hypothetical protein